MALSKELMGSSSLTQNPPFLHSINLESVYHNNNQFSVKPNRSDFRPGRFPVIKAAISEDVAKFVNSEKPVSFKVRAVLTVRNKYQEDLKETIVKKIDAFIDQIGRNVVLEVFSQDIDPSMLILR